MSHTKVAQLLEDLDYRLQSLVSVWKGPRIRIGMRNFAISTGVSKCFNGRGNR